MARKERGTDHRERFSLSKVAPHRVLDDTGDVTSTSGENGTTRAYTCSSLIIEARYPRRRKVDGHPDKKKSHFAIWHVFPKHIHNTGATPASLREVDSERAGEIGRMLDKRRPLTYSSADDTERPEDIIAGMIEHLKKKMPGAKISATLTPGTHTLSTPWTTSRNAYDTIHEILKRQKEIGVIRNIHLRGASNGLPKGASHVWIKNGRLYRDGVRRT